MANVLQPENLVDPKKGIVFNMTPHANGRASIEMHGTPPKLAHQISKLVHAAATKPKPAKRSPAKSKPSTKKQEA